MLRIKLIAVLLTAVLLLAVFTGCSSMNNVPSDQNKKTEAKECLDVILRETYFYTDATDNPATKFSQQLYSMVTYRVLNAETEFYEIEITYPNLGKYLLAGSLDSNDFTTEESLKEILSVLESNDLKTVTEIIQVEVAEGKPVINDALMNAYSGGMLSALTDVIDQEVMEHIKAEESK